MYPLRKVYLDYAATTSVRPKVFKAMVPFFTKNFGNASEPHLWGVTAKKALEEAREKIAKFLGANPSEIIFTSCATESINLSHKGLFEVVGKQGSRIITLPIEHKAVLETCKHLEKSGARIDYVEVDGYGLVDPRKIKALIKKETILVSIMFVNNEIGTVEPIKKIGKMIRKINLEREKKNWPKVYFHSDVTQAIQYYPVKVDELNLDLLSLTGHKVYAPKGVGALYVRKGTLIARQQNGGGQEASLRSGTENIPYIVGLAKALELAEKEKSTLFARVEKLRNRLIKGILKKIDDTILTGHPKIRAPHIASFCVKGVEGEAMLLHLSAKGIAASSGSACTSDSLDPSHVLTAIGIAAEIAHGSLRFSLGKDTTGEDIDYVLKILPEIVKNLRKMAPQLD